jgi:sugar transferase (PEP-CTERM/EpsH1 system associated)
VRILYVAARFPTPARQGFQVRAQHQIRLLAPRHRITLVAFAPREPSPAARADLERHCEEIVTVPLGRAEMLAGLARGALSDRPLQTALYETPAMRRAIGGILAARRHDVVHVQLARMARHCEGSPTPVVVDLIDALSLNMERRATRDPGPARFAAAFEAKRLRRYEQWLCRTFAHATVVSEIDRAAIGDFPNLTINPNGVASERLPNGVDGERPPGSAGRETRLSDCITFTGNLGYFPNVDAVEWFVHEVLPRIQRARPAARFVIAGTRPHRRVRALARADGAVVVESDPPDLRSALCRAAVAVAPMHAGSGQPLKILEAMACGTPVVATPLAASGLEVEAERDLLIGADADAFAAQVSRILESPALAETIAGNARRLVESRYSWERSVAGLEAIYHAVAPSAAP